MRLRTLVLACAVLWPGLGQAECRQALALGMDVSGSVDAGEYRLQTDGLAAALLAPDVQAAFLAVPEAPVRLMIYEWSGVQDQRVLLDWAEIDSVARLAEAASRLRMEVDSKPEELDALDRQILQLQIEEQPLQLEDDAAAIATRRLYRDALYALRHHSRRHPTPRLPAA